VLEASTKLSQLSGHDIGGGHFITVGLYVGCADCAPHHVQQ